MPDRRIAMKFCGLSRAQDISAAVAAGAAYVGFVFFDRSPRNLTPEAAAPLAAAVPESVIRVGLMVDPDDATLDRITALVPLDMIQLHGQETPGRVAAIRARTGLKVMKAVGIRDRADLDRAAVYRGIADMLLLDAKPPEGAALPGGNGLAFDWRLLRGLDWDTPWMLAGGLTPENVAEAVRLTGAQAVDVSSGVESAPGVKSPQMIRDFAAALPRVALSAG